METRKKELGFFFLSLHSSLSLSLFLTLLCSRFLFLSLAFSLFSLPRSQALFRKHKNAKRKHENRRGKNSVRAADDRQRRGAHEPRPPRLLEPLDPFPVLFLQHRLPVGQGVEPRKGQSEVEVGL